MAYSERYPIFETNFDAGIIDDTDNLDGGSDAVFSLPGSPRRRRGRGLLATGIASGLAAALAIGLVPRWLDSQDSPDALPPVDSGGRGAAAPLEPSPEQSTGNPTRNGGVFNSTWQAACAKLTATHVSGSSWRLTPKIVSAGAPSSGEIYTVGSYQTDSNANSRAGETGTDGVTIDLTGAWGVVTASVVHFPDPNNQPREEDMPGPGELTLGFPGAKVVSCGQLFFPEAGPDGNVVLNSPGA